MWAIGVDIGGTFTDFILYETESGEVRVHKVPSTPAEPERALIEGLAELSAQAGVPAGEIARVLHGTTVATNAVLEHDGAPVGMITTRGFRDIVHIGRHQRPLHYSVMQDIPWQASPFVQRRHRKVVSERIVPPWGEVLTPLEEDEVRTAARELRADGIDAVAICFLFSYLNPIHEQRAAAIVREEIPGAFVTTSAGIVPQFREFERFTTATMNAFVGPKTGRYLSRLAAGLEHAGVEGELHVMTSSGGVASADGAAEHPVTLLMSGPAAGVLGGQAAGMSVGRRRLITFDMGGTSTDIGIVTEQGITVAAARDTWVGGYPLLAPMLDVHTIGAGGGSIAYVDDGGAFRVGPRSAGAVPGPACYGQGGLEPTITDAHLVLGRLDPQRALGGRIELDRQAAVEACEGLAVALGLDLVNAAEGIITVANSNMARAIRSRTIEKGHDPRDFALVAFGGAGPLHAAELADSLDIPEVVVPPFPGITSAGGLLTSDLSYERMRTVFQLQGQIDADSLNQQLAELESELRERLRRDGVGEEEMRVIRALDCRYAGQGYELRVTLPEGPFNEDALEEFHELHTREYGNAHSDPIEIVNARATAVASHATLQTLTVGANGGRGHALIGEAEGRFRIDGELRAIVTRYYDRAMLPLAEPISGPAVVFHPDTTTVIPPGWSASAHGSGTLVLVKEA